MLGVATCDVNRECLNAASAASKMPRVPLDILEEKESEDELNSRGMDMGDSPNVEPNDGEMAWPAPMAPGAMGVD